MSFRSVQRIALPAVLALAVCCPRAAGTTDLPDPAVDDLAAVIAELHGLPAPDPVAWSFLGRDKLRERLSAIVSTRYGPEEIVDEARLLARLGLLPPTTHYEDVVFGLLEEQVMGLYDPASEELMLMEGTPEIMLEGLLAHELTHAIQDQSFDLEALTDKREGQSDRRAALEAIAEGDALLMEQVLAGFVVPASVGADEMQALMQLEISSQPSLAKAPGFIRSVLLFPYVHGFVLVRRVHAEGGYEAVNDLFRSPPESTEQVLHPEKLGQDPPVEIEIATPASLVPRYRIAYDDVMGEFGIRAWLEEWMEKPAARAAARGWGGDRQVLLWPASHEVAPGHQGHGILLIATVWDGHDGPGGDREAIEFHDAIAAYVAARYPHAEPVSDGDATTWRIPGDQMARLERRGRSVCYVEGVPPDEESRIPELIAACLADE